MFQPTKKIRGVPSMSKIDSHDERGPRPPPDGWSLVQSMLPASTLQALAHAESTGVAETFAEILRQHVWSSPASSPGLAGAPETRILDLVHGGEPSDRRAVHPARSPPVRNLRRCRRAV